MRTGVEISGIVLAIVLAIALVASAGGVSAEGSRTLTGEYVLPGGEESGELEAVFTPIGTRAWSVDFHFTFQGQAHTWSGSAQGSLGDGRLEGTVEDESRSRTFIFAGEFEEGTFRGAHAEVADGLEEPTGTMTLAEERAGPRPKQD